MKVKFANSKTFTSPEPSIKYFLSVWDRFDVLGLFDPDANQIVIFVHRIHKFRKCQFKSLVIFPTLVHEFVHWFQWHYVAKKNMAIWMQSNHYESTAQLIGAAIDKVFRIRHETQNLT